MILPILEIEFRPLIFAVDHQIINGLPIQLDCSTRPKYLESYPETQLSASKK